MLTWVVPQESPAASVRRNQAVSRNMEKWAVGDVRTNTIEKAWSPFKRFIFGSFHKVSENHLDRYLEEMEWRYSNR